MGWWLLNGHLGYNPTIYWRILFRSGGRPRQFSILKFFRDLADPGGVYCKGIIVQGMHLPSGLPVTGQSCSRRRGDVMGASVHEPRQRNSSYGQTVIWSIYKTRWPKHPHYPINMGTINPRYQLFMEPLQELPFYYTVLLIIKNGSNIPDRNISNNYSPTTSRQPKRTLLNIIMIIIILFCLTQTITN